MVLQKTQVLSLIPAETTGERNHVPLIALEPVDRIDDELECRQPAGSRILLRQRADPVGLGAEGVTTPIEPS